MYYSQLQIFRPECKYHIQPPAPKVKVKGKGKHYIKQERQLYHICAHIRQFVRKSISSSKPNKHSKFKTHVGVDPIVARATHHRHALFCAAVLPQCIPVVSRKFS